MLKTVDAPGSSDTTVRSDRPDRPQPDAEECRRRMLQWPNPVDYVNNMYGCHPGKGDTDYFTTIFGK